jgi:hypothetical protein
VYRFVQSAKLSITSENRKVAASGFARFCLGLSIAMSRQETQYGFRAETPFRMPRDAIQKGDEGSSPVPEQGTAPC